MNKKCTLMDKIVLALEVASPIISIIITCIIPQGKELSSDMKLAIIGAGISIPIVLLQISVTVGQNSTNESCNETEKQITEVSDKLNHVSPILEQVFLSKNDRIKRFVYRRMDEVTNIIQLSLNNNNSGNLKPSEYYEELLYLSELIIHDKENQKKKFTGEVWAMTSFAEDEWIADEGYEKLWTEKLKELSDKGIKSRRLCIVSDNVYSIISNSIFTEPQANTNNSFSSFITLLKIYYGNPSRKKHQSIIF